jgi:hypothetical protein
MLRAITDRRDSGHLSTDQNKPRTWDASASRQYAAPKSKINHKHKASAIPKVTFKSQTSGPSRSQAQQTKRTSASKTNTTPVSKRHKAFASLLVSFLATSSVTIDMEAVDAKTIESANKASTTPLPPPPPKALSRSASGVRPSEIRKTRWKRFKYEMGLKMRSGHKGKQRRLSAEIDEMEMVDLLAQERETERKKGRRVGTA